MRRKKPATRDDLFRGLNLQAGIKEREARVIINALLTTMGDLLAEGREIELKDFGVFVLKHRKARTRRTKQVLNGPGFTHIMPREIRETVYIKFRASRVITDRLKNKFYAEQLRKKSKGSTPDIQGVSNLEGLDDPQPPRKNQNLARLEDYRRSQDRDGASSGTDATESQI